MKKKVEETVEEKEDKIEQIAEKLPPLDSYSLVDRLRLSAETPMKNRLDAAAVMKMDLLLPLTKPVIPLVMLLASGQVWSGLVPSLVVMHVMRKFVPEMNYETQHLLCFVFGFLHTLLGITAVQLRT